MIRPNLLASFSTPVLFEKVDLGDFSETIRAYYLASKYITSFQSYGTIEVINLTSITVICGTKKIKCGQRGLFWSSFSKLHTLDSPILTISNTFNKIILGKTSCIFSVHSAKTSREVHSKITLSESADKSEEYISGLIEQFKRYQEEYVENCKIKEFIYSERKKEIPEFVKFLENPEVYEIELRKNGALIFEIENGPVYHL
jgi:hypothetical protein